MLKKALLVAFAVSCALTGHAQTTTITANNISYFGGAPVTGRLCLSPTDNVGTPINIETPTGQQIPASTPVCFTVTAGVLATAVVPDTALTNPANPCYKTKIYDGSNALVGSFACLQPTGSTWSLDTFVPTTLPNTTAMTAAQFQLNGSTLANQRLLNFICPACTYINGSLTLPTGANGGPGGPVTSNENLTFSATPVFSLSTTSSHILLSGNVTNFSLPSGTDGQHKCLTFAHDGTTTQYTVAPPANVVGFFYIATQPEGANKRFQQCFTYYTADNVWVAESAGVINQ